MPTENNRYFGSVISGVGRGVKWRERLWVVLYAVKMYLACALMLKKRLLPLMIDLWLPMVVTSLYNLRHGGSKFQLMLILPDEFNKRTDFEKLMLHILLFFRRRFLRRGLLHQSPNEKILNWPRGHLEMTVYLVGLRHVKNYYTFKCWYIYYSTVCSCLRKKLTIII